MAIESAGSWTTALTLTLLADLGHLALAINLRTTVRSTPALLRIVQCTRTLLSRADARATFCKPTIHQGRHIRTMASATGAVCLQSGISQHGGHMEQHNDVSAGTVKLALIGDVHGYWDR